MAQQIRPTTGNSDWFTHDRFGLFIHWGLYALAARHEWVKSREQIPDDVYDNKYFKHFDPDLYDPDQWAAAASDAGMKYFVVTTKHHEGFCLWDSDLTDYKATNTPAGRDLLTPMVEAFNRRGLRTGFYYSLIDWHHPDYVIDTRRHPYFDLPEAERQRLNADRDQMRYVDYMHAQVRELLTRYEPAILWLDYSMPDPEHPEDWSRGKGRTAWRSAELLEHVRSLAPKIILNDRLDLDEGWDVKTPEQAQPRQWPTLNGQRVVWEACQTFSGSWGYYRDEHSWRSTDQLIRTLIDCVSKGGNLLLNVGPTGRGTFDHRAIERLRGIGEWMKDHDRSIHGCTQAPDDIPTPEDCRLTYNPKTNRLYVHIFAWPYKHLHLDRLVDRVRYAQLLHDGSEVYAGPHGKHVDKREDTLILDLPLTEPNVRIPVIELFLKDGD